MALAAALLDRRTIEVHLSGHANHDVVLSGMDWKIRRESLSSTVRFTASEGAMYADSDRIEPDCVLRFGEFQLAPFELELSPPAFLETLDGVDETAACERWSGVLSDADKAIRLHGPSRALSAAFGRVIVPVMGSRADVHSSVSFSTHPGILYMSWCPRASVVAEAIVHESDHQLFYVLCREFSLWQTAADDQPAIFRSPWRDDPRPLDGLLRGSSAFIRVAEFWSGVANSDGFSLETPEWACGRAVLAACQSLDALQVIGRHGGLTSVGSAVTTNLEERARQVISALSDTASFDQWMASAKSERCRHDETWRNRHSTADGDCVANM